MESLSLKATLAKYKLGSDNPWYLFLTLTMPGHTTPDLRYVLSNEDTVWHGDTYTASAFDVEVQREKPQELPTVRLSLSNVNRVIEALLTQYNGATGATVVLSVVHHDNLGVDVDEYLKATYEVMQAAATAKVATLTLGAPNMMKTMFPRYSYTPNFCRHFFNSPTAQANLDERGVWCRYEGSATTCSHLIEGDNGCRAKGNLLNFGGFPGIESFGFINATAL